jgi:hypothetical protein
MVEQIPATVADPALGDSVLPRAPKARSLWLDAEAFHCVDHSLIEVGPAIKDQIFGRGIVGKCFAQLLNNPCTRRIPGDIAVKNAPPVVRNDEKTTEQAESLKWPVISFGGCCPSRLEGFTHSY